MISQTVASAIPTAGNFIGNALNDLIFVLFTLYLSIDDCQVDAYVISRKLAEKNFNLDYTRLVRMSISTQRNTFA